MTTMSKFFTLKKVSAILSISLCVQAASFLFTAKDAQAANLIDVKLEVKSAILMEASTGQVVYEFNADEALPPASMSKMMTEYLVVEGIKSGKFKWEDKVTTSQWAQDVIGSGDMLTKGEQLSIKDMFAAMSIYSANDASVALAEHYAGTEEKFAQMMNEKAKALGLSDKANFINATGLSRADTKANAPASIQGETMLTARDAALMAFHIVKDHKEMLEVTKIPQQKLREKDAKPMVNWNWMVAGNKDNPFLKAYAYEGLDGLKTGHTDEAGYCFTGTAERNGMRLISVVMGAKTEPKRFEETRKLLDAGFNALEKKQVMGANASLDELKTIAVKKGKTKEVPVVTEGAITFVAKKGATDAPKITAKALEDASKLEAPIKKGAVVGTATIEYAGTKQTVNLVASEDVEKGGFIRLFFRGLGDFFSGLFKKAMDAI